MTFIFDSGPLLYLGKAKLLGKLVKLGEKLIIPKSVYREVVEIGLEKGFEDAAYVKDLIDSGVFLVKSPKNKLKVKGISEADKETLELAKELGGIAITDDQKLRSVCSIEKVDSAGSIFLIFVLVKNKALKKDDAKKAIDRMIDFGWYCSTDLYATIINSLIDH